MESIKQAVTQPLTPQGCVVVTRAVPFSPLGSAAPRCPLPPAQHRGTRAQSRGTTKPISSLTEPLTASSGSRVAGDL